MLIKRGNIFILTIIIFMCTFLNISDVNAEILDSSITPGLANQLEQVRYINTYGLTDEEVISIMSTYYTEFYNNGTVYDENSSVISKYIAQRNWIKNNDDSLGNYFFNLSYLYYNIDLNNTNAYINFSYDTVSNSMLGYYGSNFLMLVSKYNTYYYSWNGTNFYKDSGYTYNKRFRVDASLNMWSDYSNVIYYAFYECNFELDLIVKSEELIYGRESYYNDGFNFNGSIYYPGDTLPYTTMTGFNSLSKEPKINSYSNSFDTTNIDYIKVKLDVNDIIDSVGSVEFDYSLNNYVLDGVADELPFPYIETIYDDYELQENGVEYHYMQYRTDIFDNYSGSMAVNLLQDLNTTVYYNFVIDTRNYNDVLQLDFSSFLGYEVVLYYSDGTTEVQHTTGTVSSTDTYTPSTVTINLNDYKGIVLMPKVYSYSDSLAELYGGSVHYNQDNTVFLNGVYDIFVYTNPGNYVTLTDTYKSYKGSYFTYNFSYIDFMDDKNTNYMKIIKVDSSDITDYTITIDTNMFTYSLIGSYTDNIIIDNVNIPGQTINTGTVDEAYKLYEANQSLSDVDSSIDKVTNLINDMKECMLVFSNLITFTYNSLNSYCQSFIVVTFIILVVVGIILILRR